MITFDEFWNLYGHKLARKQARKAWEKLSSAEHSEIMNHLPERLLTDKQWLAGYKMHPATFLNGERWFDEYEKCTGNSSEGIGARLARLH